MCRRRWTEEEDSLVRALYPTHGAAWDGWSRLLPGRTQRQVTCRANSMGVYSRAGLRHKRPRWTAAEDAALRDAVAAGARTRRDMEGAVPGKGADASYQRARKLGLIGGRASQAAATGPWPAPSRAQGPGRLPAADGRGRGGHDGPRLGGVQALARDRRGRGRGARVDGVGEVGEEMSKISDELRKFTNTYDLNSLQIYELEHIADRIDAEMVELPRDRDGAPIHVGDTVYAHGFPDGNGGATCKVCSIEFNEGRESRIELDAGGVVTYRTPSSLTHTQPDSWERIADELDEMVDAADSADDRCEKLADFADRIRKLAEREGK